MCFICCLIWFLAGVRYFIRGVDDDGNVANYVETEQMMIYCDYRASFVQVIVYICRYIAQAVHPGMYDW